MGRRGRELVRKSFSWSHEKRTLLGFYERIAGSAKEPAGVRRAIRSVGTDARTPPDGAQE
jgi:hypothetical protein